MEVPELDKIIKAKRIVDLWVTKEISQEKRDELVEMVLKEGTEAFKRSNMLKEINKGNGLGTIYVTPS